MTKGLLGVLFTCFIFIGCSNETKEEVKQATNNTIDKVAEVSNEAKNETSNTIDKIVEKTKEVTEEATQKTSEVVNKVVEKTKEVASNVQIKTTEITEDVKQKIHEATASTIDAKALYVKCIACHGANAEKKALNASQIIQNWDENKIYDALKGYKDGTYGGAMKGVMQGQVKNFSIEEMKALSKYITTL